MHSQDISHNLPTTGLFPWSKVVLCPWLPSLTPSQPPRADRFHSKKQPPPVPGGCSSLLTSGNQLWRRKMHQWWRQRWFSGELHSDLFASHLEVWKKTPLWKVSYEECSLFETSTTQTPTLSRIESLAVHINTFQAQIKKCKQNKKIYIYIIFSPIQRFQVSMQQILLNTDSLRSTLFKQLGQTGPCKGYCLFNTWGGDHGRHGTGGRWERERRKNEQEMGNGYALEKMGQLGHKRGELVDFIYWFLTFSFRFVLISPFPGPPKIEKPHSRGWGLIRPAQSLQSTPGWPVVACGGASQSFHRQAGPAD